VVLLEQRGLRAKVKGPQVFFLNKLHPQDELDKRFYYNSYKKRCFGMLVDNEETLVDFGSLVFNSDPDAVN